MEKIALDLFTKYAFLANLTAYRSKLLFNEYKCDLKNNDYLVRLHELDPNSKEDVILADWQKNIKTAVLADELFLLRKDEDYHYPHTKFYRLIDGKEELAFELPLAVGKIDILSEEYYLVSSTIKTDEADLYLADEAAKEKVWQKKEANKDYVVFDEYPFFFNGEGIINGNRNTLFLVDRKTLAVKRITLATMDVESYDFKDGKILYTGIDFESFKGKWSKVYEYDLNTGETATLFDGVMQITRSFYDGDDVVVAGTFAKEYGAMESSKFYILKDGTMTLAVDVEYSLYNSVGSDCRYGSLKNYLKHDGVSYFITSYESRSIVLKYHDRRLTTFVSFEGSVDDMCFLDHIYIISLKDQKLQEVYDGESLEALTDLNEAVLFGKYVGKPHKVTVDKPMKVDGWVIEPIDYDPNKKYPAILDIHGGPKCSYGEVFYHEMQHWASLGYFVMYCNPRGSDGKGNAYADLRHNYGKIDYEDIMDFVDKVLEVYPSIDPDHLGVTGGSYGGYMTNWIIGHTDRFKGAATQRSISNWISMVCASDYGIDFPIEQEFDDLYNCQEELWDMSPLKYANNVKTPTLFIHSTEDYRCPIPEGIQLYTVLKCRQVDAKLVAFIGENHELSRSGKPLHRIKRLEEITNWLNKYVR